MRVRVRFFAGTRDAVGASALDVDAQDGDSLAQLFDQLAGAHPKLAAYRAHVLLALDGEPAPLTTRLRAGAEIAIMPPVSGGSLHAGPVRADDALARLRTSGAGAVVTFLGLARPPARTLRFEAHETMARKELDRVREEAIAKFGLIDCAIEHATGDVPEGAPAVAVAVAARHRREAFEAAAWVMDELKARVSIWKQEITLDGSTRWINDPTQG